MRILLLRLMLAVVGLFTVVAGAWGLLWGVGVLSEVGKPTFERHAFDRATWVAHRGDYTSSRGQMLDDLVQNHLKRGMTRREVFALLGEPDQDFPPISAERDPDVRSTTRGYGYFAGPYYECVFQMVSVDFNRRDFLVSVFLHRPKDVCED